MIESNDLVAQLRRRAESRLRRPLASDGELHELAELVHELEVHKAELDIQNEELRRATVELEEAKERYRDLFVSAPVGLLTVNEAGVIGAANDAAAGLHDADAQALEGRCLTDFFEGPLAHHSLC